MGCNFANASWPRHKTAALAIPSLIPDKCDLICPRYMSVERTYWYQTIWLSRFGWHCNGIVPEMPTACMYMRRSAGVVMRWMVARQLLFWGPIQHFIRHPGTILCMRPANERRRYIVTSSFTGWAHLHKVTPRHFIVIFRLQVAILDFFLHHLITLVLRDGFWRNFTFFRLITIKQ